MGSSIKKTGAQIGGAYYLIRLDCLITSAIKMKVVLITYVIQYTIYFTIESIIFEVIAIGVLRARL